MSLCDAPRSFLALETLVETGHGVSEGIEFIYSEKAIEFCEISTLLLSYVVPVKSKLEIFQNFVAFSECMNFNRKQEAKVFGRQSEVSFQKPICPKAY